MTVNFTERRTSNYDRRKNSVFTEGMERFFHIMVVTKDKTQGEQISARLNKFGYQTFISHCLSEIHCFNQKHPDIIVICCDQESNAHKSHLKPDDYLHKTPVIMLRDRKHSPIEGTVSDRPWTEDATLDTFESLVWALFVNTLPPDNSRRADERRKSDRRWPAIYLQESIDAASKTDHINGGTNSIESVSGLSQLSFKSTHDLFNLVLVSLHPDLYLEWLAQLSWETFISTSSVCFDRPELLPILLNHARPNLLLLDTQDLEAPQELWLKTFYRANSQIDIILIGNDDPLERATMMVDLKISGIVSRKDSATKVTRVIRSVIEGNPWLPGQFSDNLINELRAKFQLDHSENKCNPSHFFFDESTLFTEYEQAIVKYAMLGFTNEQIAKQLNTDPISIQLDIKALSNKFNNIQAKRKQIDRKLH